MPLRVRERVLNDCVSLWRRHGFPHFDLSSDDIAHEFDLLCATPATAVVHGSTVRMNMTAIRMASYFHPNMWRVRVGRAHSPHERFNDDTALRAMLRKALTIWPDFRSVNACNLRSMLRTYSNTARVSNFRPTAARAIYAMFSVDGDTVVDFSSGYGGRLVGCLSLRRTYIGIDPCRHQIAGLRRTHLELRRRSPAAVELICDAAEDVLPTLPSGFASLIFSSPPYFRHERYCSEKKQCCRRYAAYEDWVDGFLTKVVAESHRVLRPGGRFVINVADAGGMPLIRDVVRLAGERFTHDRTLQLQLGAKPYLRRPDDAYKTEPIFVFAKK